MDGVQGIYLGMDPWLIWAFRLPEHPGVGFGLGLCWVSLVATLVGALSGALICRFNSRHYASLNREMAKQHNLSLKALAARDKTSYKASNLLANDAFGRFFFAQLALNAASLWPLPFLLGWLDFRFHGQTFAFPLAGQVGPPFLFIPLYIATRVLFNRVKRGLSRLPGLKRFRPKIDEQPAERMLTLGEIFHRKPEKEG